MDGERPPTSDHDSFVEHPAASTTVQLLEQARAGNVEALDEVFRRAGPALRRWARGRLPGWARDLLDTDDLVQETMIKTLRTIDVFEYRTDAALQGYFRQAVMNGIRNEIRRAHRHPKAAPLDSEQAADELSPLETLIGKQTVDAYESALAQLSDDQREAIIGRIELGLSYQDLAVAMGRPSADAARMAVGRALVALAKRLEPHA